MNLNTIKEKQIQVINEKTELTQRQKSNRIKKVNAYFAELEKMAEMDITQISVTVEWRKSATWGYNPKATVDVYTNAYNRITTTAKASGCGYCKESAAVAEALNYQDLVLLCLTQYANWNTDIKAGDIFGFGVTRYGKSDFFRISGGGVGMNSIINVFRNMGWTTTSQHGKTFDCYTWTRGK